MNVTVTLQVWEVIHKGSGYAAIIVSIAAIFTGMQTISPAAPDAALVVYGLIVALAFTTFGACEIAR